VGNLVHPPKHVQEDASRALCRFHHAERIAGEHGGPFLRCFLGEQILNGFDGRDTEFLKVATNDGVLKDFLGGVLKNLAQPTPEY